MTSLATSTVLALCTGEAAAVVSDLLALSSDLGGDTFGRKLNLLFSIESPVGMLGLASATGCTVLGALSPKISSLF